MSHPSHICLASALAMQAEDCVRNSNPTIGILGDVYRFLSMMAEVPRVPTEVGLALETNFREMPATALSPGEAEALEPAIVRLTGLRLLPYVIERTETTLAVETMLEILYRVLTSGGTVELNRYRAIVRENPSYHFWIDVAFPR